MMGTTILTWRSPSRQFRPVAPLAFSNELIQNAPQTELIAVANRLAPLKIDLQQFLAMHCRPRFIGQTGDNGARRHVDHVARRGISQLAIEAEGNPTGLFAYGDA